jgi:hypothetical protein
LQKDQCQHAVNMQFFKICLLALEKLLKAFYRNLPSELAYNRNDLNSTNLKEANVMMLHIYTLMGTSKYTPRNLQYIPQTTNGKVEFILLV